MKRKQQMMNRALSATAASAILAANAFGAENEQQKNSYSLNEVVVTASRSAEQARNVPANVTVITAADIEQGNYSDVVSVLKNRAGLHFRSFSGNQEASVDIRGFGENSFGRVLIMRDGRKLNRPDMRGINWHQIPLANVERIEIIRGGNSAMYGDQAVSGVINIITKKGGAETEGQVLTEVGTEDYNRQAASVSGTLAGVQYAASFDRSESAGWRDRTGARTEAGDLSLGYAFAENFLVDLNLNVLSSDYEMPGSLPLAQYEDDPQQAGALQDEGRLDQFGLNTTFTVNTGEYGKMLLDLGYLHREIESDMFSWWSWDDLTLKTWSVSPRYVLTAPVLGLENRLTVGFDWIYDTIEIDRYASVARNNLLGKTEVEKDSLAFYFNDTLHLNDSLLVSAGARFAKSTFEVDDEDGAGNTVNDEEDTHREQAYHLGLTWLPTESTKVFAKYEKVYRLPSTNQQIMYSGWAPPAFNKDMVPETGDSYELGIEHMFNEKLNMSATLFRMEMEDEIMTDFASPSLNSNADETVHQGLELSMRTEPIDRVSLYANYTYLVAEFDAGVNDGNEIPLVPKHKIGAGVAVRPVDGLRLSLDATHTSQMHVGGDNANAGDKLGDYTVVDLGVAYAIPGEKTTWKIFGGVDNLFDEDYTDFAYNGGYYPAPGRTCKVGVKMMF